ncbi:dihydroxyacetone kinase [Annulohypoxylon nitens]|nr:dihydroxyacetone kinase [Annulohypoxylon nitens]
MSTRHIFSTGDGLVNKALRGVISYNTSLRLDELNRVVFDAAHDRSKVSIIGGGGSGHEPAWSGYVGHNMLAASVSGGIFASPSTRQITAAMNSVPSDSGLILIFGNYTGDRLHFGLALEKALARGVDCRMIVFGDDVSIGKKAKVGRRGMAGQMLALKAMGALAGAGGTLDEVYGLGSALADQIVSIAVTLDHCHVPGRGKEERASLPVDVIEIGTGPHNEPGYRKLSPIPPADELIRHALSLCLDETDPERGYVKFTPDDTIALLVNNFGGISILELAALVDEVLAQLAKDWNIEPVRVYYGSSETSLNAPAFSLSLMNIEAAASKCSISTKQILGFLDAKTNTCWESMAGYQEKRRERVNQLVQISTATDGCKVGKPSDYEIKGDPGLIESMFQRACSALVEAEPDLTKWDTVMGDGDCGETFSAGATGILNALSSQKLPEQGCIVALLDEVGDIVERQMGGTLGGILGIFFVGLRNAFAATVKNSQSSEPGRLDTIWPSALSSALEHLCRYTTAKEGDRTIMDVLIPFVRAMEKGGFDEAVEAAIKGAYSTKGMPPKLGRATYVQPGMENSEAHLPDPGAWGAMIAIVGLRAGLRSHLTQS